MRTKTLLLTAALAVATTATTMADVFSVNVVGYVNRTIPTGFSITANPLVATNNTLAALFPTPPLGSSAYLFANGNYTIYSYEQDDNGVSGWSGNPTLLPGQGFFFRNSGAQFTNTFVGEVLQGSLTNPIVNGFNLKSSQVPQSGALDSALGFVPHQGDSVYLFRNGTYSINTYEQDDNGVLGWSSGSAPVPEVAEGFFIRTTTPGNWTRTFTVN